jgi:hypothetical protein
VTGLLRNDPDLRDLNHWFRGYALDHGIVTRTLTETRKTWFVTVVPPDTADAGLLSDPIPVDANHFDIAAPGARDSETYRHIRSFLASPAPPRIQRPLPPPRNGSNDA